MILNFTQVVTCFDIKKLNYFGLLILFCLLITFTTKAQTVSVTKTDGLCPSAGIVTASTSSFPSNANLTFRLMSGATQVRPTIPGSYQAGNVFTGLDAGIYTVETFDQQNNIIVSSAPIAVNINYTAMVINTNTTAINCLGATNGTIAVYVTGGNVPPGGLLYSIDGVNFQSSNVFTGLPAASYTVYVKDACVTLTALTTVQQDLLDVNSIANYGSAFYMIRSVVGDCSTPALIYNGSAYKKYPSAQDLSPTELATFSFRFRYNGVTYGQGGVVNGSVYPLNASGIEVPNYTGGNVEIILYDNCGNSTTFNVTMLKNGEISYAQLGCNAASVTAVFPISSGAFLCYPLTYTLTDQAAPFTVFTFTRNAPTDSYSFLNSGLLPGHTYNITGQDNTGFNIPNIGSTLTVPLSPTPATLGANYDYCAFNKLQYLLIAIPAYTTGDVNIQIVSSPGGALDGNNYTISSPSQPFAIGAPAGNYTVSYTSICQSGTISASLPGFQGQINNFTATPICGGNNLVFNVNLDVNFSNYRAVLINTLDGSRIVKQFVNNTTSEAFSNIPYGNYRFAIMWVSFTNSTCEFAGINVNLPAPTNPIVIDPQNTGGIVCNTNAVSTGQVVVTATSITGSALSYSLDDITYQTSNIFPGLPYGPDGKHTIYVKDACGNKISYIASQTVPPVPTASVNAGASVCENQNINLDVNIIGAISYSWIGPNGFTSSIKNPVIPSAAFIHSGVYTVEVDLGCGIPVSTSINVTVNPLPITPLVSTSGPTTFCTGNSILLSSSAVNGNQWYKDGVVISGANNQTFNANSAGSYTVVVTDANTCSSLPSAPVVITVNPLPSAPTISASGPVTFCSGNNVILSSSITNGNQWYKDGFAIVGEVGQTYVATTSGSYTVTTTNSNGCVSAPSIATIVDVVALPTATISYGGISFCNRGTASVTQTGQGGGTYSSTAGIAINSTTGLIDLSSSIPGNYTISYSFSNGTCTAITTVDISIKTTVLPNALPDVNGQCSVTLTPPTVTDNCSGLITATTSTMFPITTQGTTVVTWTFDYGRGFTKTATQNVIIKDDTKPVAPILADIIGQCSATVTAPTATDNCSGTVTGTTTDPLSYTAQGTYVITWKFTDAAGNFTTATQNVIIKDDTKPVAPILADIIGQCSATVTAPTATDNCSGTVTGTTTDPLSYAAQGTYVITWKFTDAAGNFTTATQNVIIKDDTKPVAPILADIIGQCSATVTAPTATDNCSGTVTGTTTDPLSYAAQGTYVITWRFTDAAGNFTTATQNVIVKDTTMPIKPILANVSGECSVTLVAPTTTDNCKALITGTTNTVFPITNQGVTLVTWLFDDGNGNVESAIQQVTLTNISAPTVIVNSQPTCSIPTGSISIIPTLGATYSIDGSAYSSNLSFDLLPGNHTITAKSINGCISNPTTIIINNQPTTPTATIAYGASQYQAIGVATVLQTGQAGGTYTSSPAGLSINSNTGTIDLANSTPNQTYTVKYTFNNGSCSNIAVTTVRVNTSPATIAYANASYCAFGSVNILRTGPGSGIYSASPSGLTINNSTGQINLSTSKAGSYMVSYTYQDGSITAVATTNIIVNALPVINIDLPLSGAVISKGDVLVLKASGGTIYSWTGSDIQSGANTSIVYVRPRQKTTYTVAVTNASGCTDISTITIDVIDDVKIIPNNVITPNTDDKNDKWIINNIDYYPNNTVYLYDRAGRLVYSKKSYNNEWDGTYNGLPLNEDVYIYVIDLGKGFGLIRGTVTIIRDKK